MLEQGFGDVLGSRGWRRRGIGCGWGSRAGASCWYLTSTKPDPNYLIVSYFECQRSFVIRQADAEQL